MFVEVPVDFLTGEASLPPVAELDGTPETLPLPSESDLAEAARILAEAERPVVWAGGGVLRAGAWDGLLALAERLDAPVVTTFMGKGAFPEDHPLFAGSACYDPSQRRVLESADVLLCVGSELGSETTYDYSLAPAGRIVQIDAAPERIGATYPALGLVGDAGPVARGATARLGAGRAGRCEPGCLGQAARRGRPRRQPASTSSSACSGRSGLPCRAMPCTRGT